MNVVLQAERLSKTFQTGGEAFHAVKGVDLQVKLGEFIAVMGPSGSGKSTLLHMLSGLERATDGRVTICDVDLKNCNDEELTRLRGKMIGFVFQFFNLIPVLSAYENVSLPMLMAGHKESAFRERATWLLSRMGLADHMHKRPKELSGGQQQRVAIARALLPDPPILVADEPTGNLDTKTAMDVLQLLRDACREPQPHSLVLVTHDPRVAAYANRVIFLRDGEVVGDIGNPSSAQADGTPFAFGRVIQQEWEALMA